MTQKKKTSPAGTPPSGPILLGSGVITPEMSATLDHMKNISGPPEQMGARLESAVASLFTSVLAQLADKHKSKPNTQ